MKRLLAPLGLSVLAACPVPEASEPPPRVSAEGQPCVRCHEEETPGVIQDWRLSAHARVGVDCATCHGTNHRSKSDVRNLKTVTLETCNKDCHELQVSQFKKGKHALAWSVMKAMPTTHWKPMELIDGMKGCGGCHKIGIKSDEEIARLKKGGSPFGFASCDACHTRHTFSVKEARDPQACATCHMGFDHPQWEMYSTSKHGVRYMMKRDGVLPASAQAPTCQTCHMVDGNHEVRTAWGFLGLRTDGLAPYPGEGDSWWKDRVVILQALGVLDPGGQPTDRLEAVKAADVVRLSKGSFDQERHKMHNVCSGCHSETFAQVELEKGDRMIREADRLLAEAIRVVARLYAEGVLKKPEHYAYAFPDLLTFHDAPTPIETRLFTMHLKHRMRAFQGVFHANPDYALWYGWSEMQQDLTDIKSMAEDLRSGRVAAGGSGEGY